MANVKNQKKKIKPHKNLSTRGEKVGMKQLIAAGRGRVSFL